MMTTNVDPETEVEAEVEKPTPVIRVLRSAADCVTNPRYAWIALALAALFLWVRLPQMGRLVHQFATAEDARDTLALFETFARALAELRGRSSPLLDDALPPPFPPPPQGSDGDICAYSPGCVWCNQLWVEHWVPAAAPRALARWVITCMPLVLRAPVCFASLIARLRVGESAALLQTFVQAYYTSGRDREAAEVVEATPAELMRVTLLAGDAERERWLHAVRFAATREWARVTRDVDAFIARCLYRLETHALDMQLARELAAELAAVGAFIFHCLAVLLYDGHPLALRGPGRG